MCKIHSHSEDTIVHRDHIHMQQTYCEAPSHSLLYAIFGYFFLFFRLSPTLPRKSFFFSFVLRMKRTHSNEHACVHMPKARPNVCKNKTSNDDDDDDKKRETIFAKKFANVERHSARKNTHFMIRRTRKSTSSYGRTHILRMRRWRPLIDSNLPNLKTNCFFFCGWRSMEQLANIERCQRQRILHEPLFLYGFIGHQLRSEEHNEKGSTI